MSCWVDKQSAYPVPEALERPEGTLIERGFTVMAKLASAIDQATDAAAAAPGVHT